MGGGLYAVFTFLGLHGETGSLLFGVAGSIGSFLSRGWRTLLGASSGLKGGFAHSLRDPLGACRVGAVQDFPVCPRRKQGASGTFNGFVMRLGWKELWQTEVRGVTQHCSLRFQIADGSEQRNKHGPVSSTHVGGL